MPITIMTKGNTQTRSRGLVIGKPYTGKSKLTTQFEERAVVLSFPGEKGTKTIPLDKENIEPYILVADTLPEDADTETRYNASLEKYSAILNVTRSIIKEYKGKDAEILFIDGLCNLHDISMDILGKGKYLAGKPFEEKGAYTTRLFSNADKIVKDYLTEVYQNTTFKYVIATSWERLADPDRNASVNEIRQNQLSGNKIWIPAFAGQLGYTINGDFDWTIRADYTLPAVCTTCLLAERESKHQLVADDLHPTYQLLPYDDVRCVGIKGKGVPKSATFIHQDWKVLKQFIS